MTRGEYWLLETAIESAIPVLCLDSGNIELFLNKMGHGMDRHLLIRTLSDLLYDGLIQVYTFGHKDEIYTPSLEQISAALDEKSQLGVGGMYYQLTKKGAVMWETFAAPEWNLFIDESYGWDEEMQQDNIGCLISTNQELLAKYFKHSNLNGYPVKREHSKWDILRPWQATYWKTLPIGYRVRFEYPPDHEPTIDEQEMFRMNRPTWYAWG